MLLRGRSQKVGEAVAELADRVEDVLIRHFVVIVRMDAAVVDCNAVPHGPLPHVACVLVHRSPVLRSGDCVLNERYSVRRA